MRNANSGFTLIEMVVVIATLAIISAVMVPDLDLRGLDRQKGCAKALGITKTAATFASQSQRSVCLVVDGDSLVAKVIQTKGSTNCGAAIDFGCDGDVVCRADGIGIVSAPSSTRFDELGRIAAQSIVQLEGCSITIEESGYAY